MANKPEPFLTLGWAAISWIEHYLVHGPGDVQGQPIDLDDEFATFILKAYQVAPKTGARRVRRAFLSRAKGRSKSGLAAMIACFEALGPCRFDHWAVEGEVSDWGFEYAAGEPVGRTLAYCEILNVATEESQAGNTYDAIYYALNPETCSPELAEDYPGLDVGLTRINLPGSRGFIEPVTSADTSKDGGKSTFIVADETHLWMLPRLKRLHGVMTRNLLKRKVASGWMLETSTMYGEGEGSVAEGTHAYATAVLTGRRKDGSLLFDHTQASKDWDLNDRKQRLAALAEAYESAAEWMNLEAIADSWDDPQVSEAEFRRYWLNQPVPMVAVVVDQGALPTLRWLDLKDAEAQRGAHPVFGADVAEDRTAWVAVAWRRDDGDVQVMLANDGQPLPAHQMVDECKRLSDTWRGPVVAPKAFESALTRAKVRTYPMKAGGFAGACGEVADLIDSGGIHHGDQAALNKAVEVVQWRFVGTKGEKEWLLKGFPLVGPLVAATRAVHGLLNAPTAAPPIGAGDATATTSRDGETAALSSMSF